MSRRRGYDNDDGYGKYSDFFIIICRVMNFNYSASQPNIFKMRNFSLNILNNGNETA